MKIRSDSLCAALTRLGSLDDFFAFVATEAPAYKDMLTWLSERGLSTSVGAIHNLVTYHMGVWRTRQAVAAAEETELDLPADADAKLRKRIASLKFDLTMRDLSTQQQLAIWKLDQAEREMNAKNANARDLAVDALLSEANGNEEATELLTRFLAALDKAKSSTTEAP